MLFCTFQGKAMSFPRADIQGRRITPLSAGEWMLSVSSHCCVIFTILQRKFQRFPKLVAVPTPVWSCQPSCFHSFKHFLKQRIPKPTSQTHLPPSRCLPDTSHQLFHPIPAKAQQSSINMCHHPFPHKFHASTHEVSLSHYQILLYIKAFAAFSSKLINFHLKTSFLQISMTGSFPFSPAIFPLLQEDGAALISLSRLLEFLNPASSRPHITSTPQLFYQRPKKHQRSLKQSDLYKG